jgi:hypothetical protein
MEELVQRLVERLRRKPKSEDVVGRVFQACPPATDEAIASTERRLGFRLPQLLKKLYLNAANGGFGPGYGVMGVEGGFTDDLGHTVTDLYENYRQPDPEDPSWLWPEQFLPICHWGCVVYSVVDCSQSPSPVYFADISAKEPGEPMETIMHLHKPSLEVWLGDWLDGKDLWGEAWGEDTDGDS